MIFFIKKLDITEPICYTIIKIIIRYGRMISNIVFGSLFTLETMSFSMCIYDINRDGFSL